MLSPLTEKLLEVVLWVALIGFIICFIISFIGLGYSVYTGIRSLIQARKNKRKVDVHEEDKNEDEYY